MDVHAIGAVENNKETQAVPAAVDSPEIDDMQVPQNVETDKSKALKQTVMKKDSEIREWKSKFSALEGTLADANLQVSSLKEQDLASKADAKREREINDILLLRIQRLQEGLSEVPQTPPRQVAHDQNISSPHPLLEGSMSYSTPVGNFSVANRTPQDEYIGLDSYYTESGVDGSISTQNHAPNAVMHGQRDDHATNHSPSQHDVDNFTYEGRNQLSQVESSNGNQNILGNRNITEIDVSLCI